MARRIRTGTLRRAPGDSATESQTFDREGLVAFLASMGWIADLPDVDRLPLLDEVRSLLTAAECRKPWETHLHWTRLAADFQNALS